MATSASEPVTPPRLRIAGMSKRYAGVEALSGVSFDVAQGEVVGLVGHNGAGKSTVSKILAGLERPSAGKIEIDGRETVARSARAAVSAGIGLVPQRLATVGTLTVQQNITLGLRERGRRDEAAIRQVADELGVAQLLDRRVSTVSPAVQRLVMIARTLLREPRILILDEPSAAFSRAEVERLFAIVRSLKERGISIIYVSHRLDEVLAICDRIVALAQGKVIDDRSTGSFEKHTLADLIAGRHVEALNAGDRAGKIDGAPGPTAPLALRLEGVVVAGKLRGIDLEIRRGEIVGLTGLVGAGRTTLLNALWGVGTDVSSGIIEVHGRRFHPRRPRDAIKAGVAYVPENRARNSLIASMTVAENVTLPTVRRYRRTGPFLRRKSEHATVAPLLERLDLRPHNALDIKISALSGGNQQKAIVARWMLLDVDVMLFDEPTEGVDVGGRADIYGMLRALADRGAAILVSSSDVEEVVDQCDRVLVLREGMIAQELDGPEQTVDRVSRACIA